MTLLFCICYALIMVCVLVRAGLGKDAFDILTQGRYNQYKTSLTLIMHHLIAKPEEWRINKDGMTWPKEGAYKVLLSKDRDGSWKYSLDGNDMKPLLGHFARVADQELSKTLKVREFQSVVRTLYPDQANLLLEHKIW